MAKYSSFFEELEKVFLNISKTSSKNLSWTSSLWNLIKISPNKLQQSINKPLFLHFFILSHIIAIYFPSIGLSLINIFWHINIHKNVPWVSSYKAKHANKYCKISSLKINFELQWIIIPFNIK